MTWTVSPEVAGARADKALAQLSGSSRALVRHAIQSGAVTLDGQIVTPRHQVQEGSVFAGEIPERDSELLPEDIPFSVAYEDDDMAVVDKPAGVVTHPGAGNVTGTLAAGLLRRWPQIEGVGADGRWGIVHRLDRDTSGLLAVALTSQAHDALSSLIKRRRVLREYLTLVAGRPETPTGTIDASIGRDPRRPTRMKIDNEGRRAVTHYRVEWEGEGVTMLRATLETGRTHQIRVHLASIGLPVAGDAVYGRAALAPRLFLHATRLRFEQPFTGADVDVTSPLPDDLEAAATAMGWHEGGRSAAGIVD